MKRPFAAAAPALATPADVGRFDQSAPDDGAGPRRFPAFDINGDGTIAHAGFDRVKNRTFLTAR